MIGTHPDKAALILTRSVLLLALFWLAVASPAQTTPGRTYPKEIRGYKVERAVVEIKKPEERRKTQSKGGSPGSNQTQSTTQNSDDNLEQTNDSSTPDTDPDPLIKLGKPKLARLTPLGMTFEVPIV